MSAAEAEALTIVAGLGRKNSGLLSGVVGFCTDGSVSENDPFVGSEILPGFPFKNSCDGLTPLVTTGSDVRPGLGWSICDGFVGIQGFSEAMGGGGCCG